MEALSKLKREGGKKQSVLDLLTLCAVNICSHTSIHASFRKCEKYSHTKKEKVHSNTSLIGGSSATSCCRLAVSPGVQLHISPGTQQISSSLYLQECQSKVPQVSRYLRFELSRGNKENNTQPSLLSLHMKLGSMFC